MRTSPVRLCTMPGMRPSGPKRSRSRSMSDPYGEVVLGQVGLEPGNGEDALVEERGGQRRVRAVFQGLEEVQLAARATGGDEGDGELRGQIQEQQIKTVPRAIPVHGREQDLASTALVQLPEPIQGRAVRGFGAALQEDPPAQLQICLLYTSDAADEE